MRSSTARQRRRRSRGSSDGSTRSTPQPPDRSTRRSSGVTRRRSAGSRTGRRLAGLDVRAPESAAGPFALGLAGDWEEAAAEWTRRGRPYEAALALAETGDEGLLRQAHDQLQQLGALPALRLVTHRLRERGVRGLARGPRTETRENPAGLTARELDVLALLVEGLRNAAIADRLVVSPRTVDHHVSAILRKLQARTRGEAVARAGELQLLPR